MFSWFSNLKIQTKIIGAFAIVLLITSAVAVFGYKT